MTTDTDMKLMFKMAGPKLSARQWRLTLTYIVLTIIVILGVYLYLFSLLPYEMFVFAISIVTGLTSIIIETIQRRRRSNRGPLGLTAYIGALFAIGGAIVLGTLVTPQLTSQQHTIFRVLWILCAFGIPIAWWSSNLESNDSQIPTVPKT